MDFFYFLLLNERERLQDEIRILEEIKKIEEQEEIKKGKRIFGLVLFFIILWLVYVLMTIISGVSDHVSFGEIMFNIFIKPLVSD